MRRSESMTLRSTKAWIAVRFARNDDNCPMTPRTATLIGLTAILMWSLLSVLTVATGKIPAFQLAAMTFAIGAAVAFISFMFGPRPSPR